MADEMLLLVGRDTRDADRVLDVHAERLRDRGVADRVRTATYADEPGRELRSTFRELDADDVHVQPMLAAHDHATLDDLPRALSAVEGDVHYAEPIGNHRIVTEILLDSAHEIGGDDLAVVLAALGSGTLPHHRETADYHTTRLRHREGVDEAAMCFLVQDPAVECARYTVSSDTPVVLPFAVTRTDATEDRIPAKLELGRGGVRYGEPLGTDDRLTDAIACRIAENRAFDQDGRDDPSFEASLVRDATPVAADGEGR